MLVALHVRAWIETFIVIFWTLLLPVALHVRAWIETLMHLSTGARAGVALHARVWIEHYFVIIAYKLIWIEA